ncbi:MAG: replication associated protein [Microviridae sp. ctQch27]|nr:MAG: replication associated protein [Microviridae sp. ctQch27]
MMRCRKPVLFRSGYARCGQCRSCRIDRRRIWAHRIMLEAKLSSASSFVTLTYEDGKLPKSVGSDSWTLSPEHLQGWLKRIRRKVMPSKLRFFAVGEYGETTFRPHYHAAIFGGSACMYGVSQYSKVRTECCEWCQLVTKSWGFGNTFVGQLTDRSAAYIAGYVVKKMTHRDDWRLQAGQCPEFARMSLKPGIGAGVSSEVASLILEFDYEDVLEDVPSTLQHEMKELPLGRYLRRRIRAEIGWAPQAPRVVREKLLEEMRFVQKAAEHLGVATKELVRQLWEPLAEAQERKDEILRRRKS